MNARIQRLYDDLRQVPNTGTAHNVFSDLESMNIAIPDPVVQMHTQAREDPNNRIKEARLVATMKAFLRQQGARDPRGATRRRRAPKRKTFRKRTTRRR